MSSSADDLSQARRAIVLAVDEIVVAQDFLANLTGAAGRDVQARKQSNGWRAVERTSDAKAQLAGGFGPIAWLMHLVIGGSHQPPIPQGDQLRRTREAVGRAIAEVQTTLAVTPPEDAFEAWGELRTAIEGIDFDECERALTTNRGKHEVTAADVGLAKATLGAAASALQSTQGRLLRLWLQASRSAEG
jgi:hypothetical protein